jgi:hypothetical protein
VGVSVNGASTIADIFNNRIFSNGIGISAGLDAKPLIGGSASKGNDIFSNADYGVQNSSSVTINATYNYWGSLSGPYHPATNPAGKGNKVSDFVDYDNYYGISAQSKTEVCAACPTRTIQAAINAANPDDVIKVHQGIYHENLLVDTTKKLTIRGGYDDTFSDPPVADPSLTVIDGDTDGDGIGDGSVIAITSGSEITIDNLTIMNGYAVPGQGGGIFAASSAGDITLNVLNAIIRSNAAEDGGGIFVSSGSVAEKVALNIINSIFAENAALSGGAISGRGSGDGNADIMLMNCTVTGNRVEAAGGGAGLFAESGEASSTAVTITNSIIWGNKERNTLTDDDVVKSGNATILVSYSNIGTEPYATAATNINADPIFVNPAVYNCRLSSGSPAIDAGTDADAPVKDFEANTRLTVADPLPDMGAAEYKAPDVPMSTLKLLSLNGGEIISAGLPYYIIWKASADLIRFTLYYSTDDGLTWHLIAKNVTGQHYLWDGKPLVPAGIKNLKQCRVKVLGYRENGSGIVDKSDAAFIIGVVRLITPNSPDRLHYGDTYTIRWVTTEMPKADVSYVNLSYTLDGGLTWKPIASGLPGEAGSYNWPVPSFGRVKKNCKVKVDLYGTVNDTQMLTHIGYDRSDTFFSIGP